MALIKVKWNPTADELRRFGSVGAGLLTMLAAVTLARHHAAKAESARFFICALVLFALALVAPKVLRPIYLVMTLASFPIGWVVSHIFLALLFFGVITPIGFLLRFTGRDVMGRRSDPNSSSYWIQHSALREVRSYFRQW